MQPRKLLVISLIILALAVSACSPAAATISVTEQTAAEEMMEKPTEETMMDKPASEAMGEKPTEDAMMEKPTEPAAMAEDEKMMDLPAWFSASLTDVRNGQTFTINGFKGKVILVETLAQWCSNCLKQQKQVLELHNLIGENPDFISIGLDIDPNEDASSLMGYVERNNFDWLYAVSPAEVTREISNLYGDQFINPPSTPMLIIDRQGQVHVLPFGIKSALQLLEALQPYLQEGM